MAGLNPKQLLPFFFLYLLIDEIITSSQFGQFSHVWIFVTTWTAAHQDSLSFTSSQSLLKLLSIVSVMSSNNLILCHPLLLLPSIFPSIRVFFKESVLRIRWPKYWSFSFSISPSNEYSGLISFRMDWLDLLAVQGTLKSLLNTTVQKHHFPFLYGGHASIKKGDKGKAGPKGYGGKWVYIEGVLCARSWYRCF